MNYRQSGVDLDKAGVITKEIQKAVPNIGLFSGGGNLNEYRIVSSIDGIGTKILWGEPYICGQDIVNHCINDIMVSGADPLFFVDYIAMSNLNKHIIEDLICGILQACKENNCALVGGETAEMPSIYKKGGSDLVGCAVGVLLQSHEIDISKINTGNILVGIESNGLHTNGYSLIRKIFKKSQVKNELNKVHKSYYNLIKNVRNFVGLRGIAHITGGGLVGNISRLGDFTFNIDWNSLPAMEIYQRMRSKISDKEMRKVFNMGIGLVLIADTQSCADSFMKISKELGENSYIIGQVI